MDEMENLVIQTPPYPIAETQAVLDDALKRQRDFAFVRLGRFEEECREFEAKYGMDSEVFMLKFESGELGDDQQWFDWYAALRGKRNWEKKYRILNGISWKI